MRTFSRVLAGLTLVLSAAQWVHAQDKVVPNAVVEAVQMPAWVERGKAKVPLAPGMELQNGDQLRTGANARLLLRTADGSSVKLGENAKVKLSGMELRADNVFAAALGVVEGAFRFTTDVLAKAQRRRLVNITVATVTAGVRGTDLWGKSEPNKQVVCLIEGKIDVTPPGEQPIVMDQALQFYVRENGQSKPVGAVDPNQLRQWATETEIGSGTGATRRGGKWKAVLASTGTQDAALNVYTEVREAGYAAEILPVKVGEKRVYLVRIVNLPSKAEAQALADALKGRMGVEKPRVTM